MVTVLKIVGERCTAKNYHHVSLVSVISKIFEKPVNNRLADHLEQQGYFSDLQDSLRSS